MLPLQAFYDPSVSLALSRSGLIFSLELKTVGTKAITIAFKSVKQTFSKRILSRAQILLRNTKDKHRSKHENY